MRQRIPKATKAPSNAAAGLSKRANAIAECGRAAYREVFALGPSCASTGQNSVPTTDATQTAIVRASLMRAAESKPSADTRRNAPRIAKPNTIDFRMLERRSELESTRSPITVEANMRIRIR